MAPDLTLSNLILRPGFRRLLPAWFGFSLVNRHYLSSHPGPVILAGNHGGFLDGPAVLAAVDRPTRFLVGRHVLSWPIIGPLVSIAGILPIGGGPVRQSLGQAIAALNDLPEALCVFPEGRLSQDGSLGKFRRGAAYLAIKTGLPIVPFYLQGSFQTWPWGKWLPNRNRLTLHFGAPLSPVGHTESSLTTALREAVVALQQSGEPVTLPRTVKPALRDAS